MATETCLTCGTAVPASQTACPVCNSPVLAGESRRLGLSVPPGAIRWEPVSRPGVSRKRALVALSVFGAAYAGGAALPESWPWWAGIALTLAGAGAAAWIARADLHRGSRRGSRAASGRPGA